MFFMGVKEVVSEVYSGAIRRAIEARVGLPGQFAPPLSPEQREKLQRVEEILKANLERSLWQVWNRSNCWPETQETRKIGWDKSRTTIS